MPANYELPKSRTCKDCLVNKPIEDFEKTVGKNTCRHVCKICMAFRLVNKYQNNKEYKIGFKRRSLKKYGVTLEQVLEQLEKQNHQCANDACGKKLSLWTPKDSEVKAVVDHNHETGKFRALLCNSCNITLGHIENGRLEKVEGLVRYSKRYN